MPSPIFGATISNISCTILTHPAHSWMVAWWRAHCLRTDFQSHRADLPDGGAMAGTDCVHQYNLDTDTGALNPVRPPSNSGGVTDFNSIAAIHPARNAMARVSLSPAAAADPRAAARPE